MSSVNRALGAKKLVLSGWLLLGLTSCATGGKDFLGSSERDNEKGVYYEASYNDHNRAPASVTPKVAYSGEDTLDPVYLRTQADYHFAMGESYSLDGRHEKAIEAFKLVQVYDPNSAQVCLRLAAEYVKLGLVSEALDQAELAVKKNGKYFDARILLGGLYSSLKQYPRAVDQYQEVLKQDPNNTEAPMYLGAVYAEQKQYDKSVSYFEALAKNEEYATPYLAHYYVGRVRMDQESLAARKAAEAAFKRSLELKPSYVEAVLALGSLYMKMGQEERAISTYKTFQKEQGPNHRVAEVLSQLYMEREQYDLAYEQLEIMEGGSEEALNIKVKMALILIEQKKYPVAIEKLQDILKQVPDSDKIQFYLAAIYEEIDKKDLAVEHFLKIPSTSQFFGEAIVHAAYILKNSKKTEEALQVAKMGYEQRKDIPQMYAVYASLLDETKDYKTAAEILKVGVEKYPDQVQLRFFLGTIQDRIGNKDQVVIEMKQVIEMDPNHVQGLNYLAFTYADSNSNLVEAEKLARRALELEPHDGYILDTLGWVLFKKGQYQEAIQVLESAHKHQPNESIIAEHLGDAYQKFQLVEKAKKMYQKAAETELDEKKVRELRSKISSIEKQDLGPDNHVRTPSSVSP
jgi:tetratricopeptide (TPR) repeat protein